jgi:hypothetical protein
MTRKTRKKETKTLVYQELTALLEHRSDEKSEHGEVFTPLELVEEMCDAFPSSLWKQKDRVWLDPSAGIGHFSAVLFFRYMTGLSPLIRDSVQRAKHIIEKMLYMVEINPDNVRRCRDLFKRLCPSATPQIYQGDFLTGSFPPSWPSAFDAVVGNPPYNLGGTKRVGSKRTHIPFTERALTLLSPRGFLGFICPPSYRQAGTPMNLLFQRDGGHFVYLHLFGAKETYQWFHIQGRVDLFLYQTGGKSGGGGGKTTVVDEYGVRSSVSLSLDRHIPNFGLPIFQKLYSLVEKHGHAEGHRTTVMTTVHADTFGCRGKHPLLHLMVEKGRRIYKTRKAHPLIGVPKLVINGLGVPYVFYDKKGMYGVSQTPIVILRPSSETVELLQSSLFIFIAWGLRLTGNNNLPYLLDAVPLTSLRTVMARLTTSEKAWIAKHFPVPVSEENDLMVPCVTGSRTQTRKKGRKAEEAEEAEAEAEAAL